MSNGRLIVLFVNRRAGSGSGRALVADLELLLRQYGFDVHTISELDQLKPYVAEHKSKVHAVVAAGGDGTVEAAANAIDADVPIAIGINRICRSFDRAISASRHNCVNFGFVFRDVGLQLT